LGFFSSHGKQYGAFYLAVNTYSGLITVTKIPNTKMETLILAVGKMTKVIIWRGGGGDEPCGKYIKYFFITG
jgi:hypothetical protein